MKVRDRHARKYLRGKQETEEPKGSGKFLTRVSALEYSVSIAEKQKEFTAQHGPVRILMKDGKPIE